jgi:GT2 family glycosyltransferase
MTSATSTKPLVAVCVLNYNGWRDAAECVRSVLAGTYESIRVLVIENGSTDDSAARLTDCFDDERVTLIPTGENLGSVGGTNFGIARALELKPSYVLTLSNDLVLAPDAIEQLVALCESDRHTGVAAPRIMYYDDPQHIWSRGGAWNAWLARATLADVDQAYQPGDTRVLDVDVLIGCVMFFRRELLETVGVLDEQYFYQCEELEFFARVRRAGWRVKTLMGTYVLHKIGRTIGTASFDRWYYATRNRLLFIDQHLRWPHRLTALVFFWGTRPLKFVQWLASGRPDLVAATWEGWRDYRLGRVGPRIATS